SLFQGDLLTFLQGYSSQPIVFSYVLRHLGWSLIVLTLKNYVFIFQEIQFFKRISMKLCLLKKLKLLLFQEAFHIREISRCSLMTLFTKLDSLLKKLSSRILAMLTLAIAFFTNTSIFLRSFYMLRSKIYILQVALKALTF